MKRWFLLFLLAFAAIAYAQPMPYPMVNSSAYPNYENGSTPVPVYFSDIVLPVNADALGNAFLAPLNASGTRFRYYNAGRAVIPTTCVPGQGNVDVGPTGPFTPVTYCANGGFLALTADPLQPGLYPGWLNERARFMGVSTWEHPFTTSGNYTATVAAARSYNNGSARLFPVMANRVVPNVAAPETANIAQMRDRVAGAGRTSACFTKAGLDAYLCVEQRLDGNWYLTRTSFAFPGPTTDVCFTQTQVNCSNAIYQLPSWYNWHEAVSLAYDSTRNVILVASAYRYTASTDLGMTWSGPLLTDAMALAHTMSYSPTLGRIVMVVDDMSAQAISTIRPAVLVVDTSNWTWTREPITNSLDTTASGFFAASLDCTQTRKRGTPPTQTQTQFCSFVYIDANNTRVVRRFGFAPQGVEGYQHSVVGSVVMGLICQPLEADAVAHYTCGESYPLRGGTPTAGCDHIYAIRAGQTNGTGLSYTRWDTTTWPNWYDWVPTYINNGIGPATIQNGIKLVYRHSNSSWYLLTRSAPYDINF